MMTPYETLRPWLRTSPALEIEADEGNLMQGMICQAIREKWLIDVTCKGLVRQLEPYLIFESMDRVVVLHSWQVSCE
jgi:hypothetical protein